MQTQERIVSVKRGRSKEGWLNAAHVDRSHCQCHWPPSKRGPVNKGTVKRGETVMCACCVTAGDVR